MKETNVEGWKKRLMQFSKERTYWICFEFSMQFVCKLAYLQGTEQMCELVNWATESRIFWCNWLMCSKGLNQVHNNVCLSSSHIALNTQHLRNNAFLPFYIFFLWTRQRQVTKDKFCPFPCLEYKDCTEEPSLTHMYTYILFKRVLQTKFQHFLPLPYILWQSLVLNEY